MAKPPTSELRFTPLHGLHLALGARMVPFAGYDMPVQYPAGVLKEHLHTRVAASLFDVSHMGQIVVRTKSGTPEDAALAAERILPADLAGLKPGRMRYSYFTNEQGGVRDDLMAVNCRDHLLLVVNGACKDGDYALVAGALGETCEVEMLDRALLALQGPQAEAALARLAPDCTSLKFLEARTLPIMGAPCVVMRSGYTGEDGFEISTPPDLAREIAEELLADAAVAPAGLGARDSLRLEAGLPLYGADIDETTTPVEAGLDWAIQKSRRSGGAREGGFPGAGIILQQIAQGAPRARVGLRPAGQGQEARAIVRGGASLYAEADAKTAIGAVTSGGFGPSLDGPMAMGYVTARLTTPGTLVFAELRGKRLPLAVTALPFIMPKYKRA
ncbi:MAG: glycine cleavage system aminomethyltransferase GcvT [Methyloceanibacter sp.]